MDMCTSGPCRNSLDDAADYSVTLRKPFKRLSFIGHTRIPEGSPATAGTLVRRAAPGNRTATGTGLSYQAAELSAHLTHKNRITQSDGPSAATEDGAPKSGEVIL